MKFREIFRFEFAYQVRRAWPWLIFAVLLVFAFLLTRDSVARRRAVRGLLRQLAIRHREDHGVRRPALAAGGRGRRRRSGGAGRGDGHASPHLHRPVSKADYLGGRFLAALVLNALILLAVQVGILLAVYAPGVDAEIARSVPAGCVSHGLRLHRAAERLRRHGGPVLAGGAERPGHGQLPRQCAPLLHGLLRRLRPASSSGAWGRCWIRSASASSWKIMSHSWTTIEKNTRLSGWRAGAHEPPPVARHRSGALAFTYLRFRFAHRTESTWWSRARTRRVADGARRRCLPASASRRARQSPSRRSQRTFGFATHARQTLAIAWTSFRTIAKSWAGLALLVAIPLLAVLVVLDQMESSGVPLLPTTVHVLSELTGPAVR